MVRANFVLNTVKKAERNFEIAARTLCLRVCVIRHALQQR